VLAETRQGERQPEHLSRCAPSFVCGRDISQEKGRGGQLAIDPHITTEVFGFGHQTIFCSCTPETLIHVKFIPEATLIGLAIPKGARLKPSLLVSILRIAMHRFVANQNIAHLAGQFSFATDAEKRGVLAQLLADEMDKLGYGYEQLEIADSRIAIANVLIQKQELLTELATEVLTSLRKSRLLFQDYRHCIIDQVRGGTPKIKPPRA
jgi:hypothetical protein